MQIVIDIDENLYTRLFDNGIPDNEVAVDDVCEMARALRRGTSLPKGHGRLIDADVLIKSTDKEEVHMYEIALAPTIIEADTESEDKE